MKDKDKIIERYKGLVHGDKEEKCITFLEKYPFLLETTFYNEKNTPFLLACERDHQEVIDYLVSKNVNVHLSNAFGENGIFFAVHTENIELINKLYLLGLDLDQRDRRSSTPLLEACIYDHSSMIEFLIEKGADVNAENEEISFMSLLLEDAFYLDFNFIRKHLDKFNEKNRRKLKGLQLKILVTKGATDQHE